MRDTFRDALRSLRRSPAFSVLTIGILAIGIGLNAAIFAVVDCVLLRPLGYRDADRIVALQTRILSENRVNTRVGGGDFVDASQQVHALEGAAYYQNWKVAVQVHGVAGFAAAAFVSPRFGEVIGATPLAGRLFRNGDGSEPEALVGAAFAREHFGSAQAALGQTVQQPEGRVCTVVGVMPAGFSFPENTEVWFLASALPHNLNRTAYNQRAIARRRAGVTPAQLNAELAVLSKRLQNSFPEDRNKSLEAVSLQDRVVGPVRPTLRLLMASVLVILLIVCANITNLQMVRSAASRRESILRSALGANRARLALRALISAAVLAVCGFLCALLLAQPALTLLVHAAPAGLPRLNEVRLNVHVLLYSFLSSLVLMVLTTLLPVWRTWQIDAAQVLRQDSARGLESRGAVRSRAVFLAAQVACTLLLAATALLLARQLIAQSHQDLGIDMQHLYMLHSSAVERAATASSPAGARGAAAKEDVDAANAARLARMNSALETLRATPGVAAAEAMNGAPLTEGWSDVSFAIRGRTSLVPGATLPDAEVRPVTPGALDLLHIPLLRGRPLNDGDRVGGQMVVLISKALADAQFHGEDAIGRQIVTGYDSDADAWTIVGVVGDVSAAPGAAPQPTVYLPMAQHPRGAGEVQFLVRTAPGAVLSEDALRERLMQAHPEIAAQVSSMAQGISEAQRELRFRTLLFESFAGVSVLLAMLGMYGATSYAVSLRTFEFGLRMALGATRGRVLASVLRSAAWIAGAGSLAGLVLYAGLLRVFASLAGRPPADPAALVLATCGVLALSLLAAALPARRASSVDPVCALRGE